MSFDRPKKNLRVLAKFGGDLAQAEAFLRRKREKSTSKGERSGSRRGKWDRKERCKSKKVDELIQQYPVQFEKLKELGFSNERRNAKLLSKFDGNLELVLTKLLKWDKEMKAMKIQRVKLNPEFKEKKRLLKEKIQKLKAVGLKREKAVKLLAMFNGEV